MQTVVLRRGLALAALVAALVVDLSAQVPTTPPPRPRLLFRAADLPALQAKITTPGTTSKWAWDLMSFSAGWQCSTSSGACPGTGSTQWRVDRSLRYMTELAARYAVMGDVNSGNNARNLLLGGTVNALAYLGPSTAAPYQLATYPCAIAATYDMIRPLLTAAERTAVIVELEAWVTTLSVANGPAGYLSNYGGATDNYSFAWGTAIAFTLLGIWGDSTLPNIPASISNWLDFLRNGYLDAVSPDGSIDESYGYANYGFLYALQAIIAGANCGFGDRARVLALDAFAFDPARLDHPFGLVFLDPPFPLWTESPGRVAALAARIAGAPGCATDGVIVLRVPKDDGTPVWPPPLAEEDRRTIGESVIIFLRPDPSVRPADP